MFISCPHCHELVAIDRETRLAPEMCPRCGGVLQVDTAKETPASDAADAGVRSFISFLQDDGKTTATETTSGDRAEIVNDGTSTDPASPEDNGEGFAAIETATEAIGDAAAGSGPQAIDAPGSNAFAASAVPPAAAAAAPMPIPPAPAATPSFTRRGARPGTSASTARWQGVLLIALSLTLALQILLADRARLAADPTWRPLVAALCDALGCSIPPWHQPGAFAMLSRDVSPIAGSAGGLKVQATFRNDARWAQAWPVLLLSLSDADGRVLGSRAFTPREYLGAATTQRELAPGQSAQIALQLREPNPNVVAFTFDFR